MAEAKTYNFYKLTEQQQDEMRRCVRGLGFDPDAVAVDFTAEHNDAGLWLCLDVLLRDGTGAVAVDGDGPAHRRTVVDVPDFLVPKFLRDPS